MNTQTVQNTWSETKAKIKTRWSKFSDTELDGFKDNLDKVASQVQKTYGIAKEQAEKEFNEFKLTLQSVVAPALQTVKIPVAVAPQADAMVSEAGNSSAKK